MKVPVLINTPRNATFREISGKGFGASFSIFLSRASSSYARVGCHLVSSSKSKPPQISRLPSNGMSSGFMRGSSMSFLLPASRTSFEGHSIQEKTTTSPSSALTARLKSVTLPSGRSSP